MGLDTGFLEPVNSTQLDNQAISRSGAQIYVYYHSLIYNLTIIPYVLVQQFCMGFSPAALCEVVYSAANLSMEIKPGLESYYVLSKYIVSAHTVKYQSSIQTA